MFGLMRFSQSLPYSTFAGNGVKAKSVVSYILDCLNKHGLHEKGGWVRPSTHVNVKVGIGEFSHRKYIQTILATKAEIAQIFDVIPQAITKHIKNIYKEKEFPKRQLVPKWSKFEKKGIGR